MFQEDAEDGSGGECPEEDEGEASDAQSGDDPLPSGPALASPLPSVPTVMGGEAPGEGCMTGTFPLLPIKTQNLFLTKAGVIKVCFALHPLFSFVSALVSPTLTDANSCDPRWATSG